MATLKVSRGLHVVTALEISDSINVTGFQNEILFSQVSDASVSTPAAGKRAMYFSSDGAHNEMVVKLADASIVSLEGAGGGVSFPVQPTITIDSTFTGAETINLNTGDGHVWKVTLTGNVTLSFSNYPTTGTQREWEVEYIQDATGNRTVAQPSEVVDTVTIDLAALSTTIITYRTNNGGTDVFAIAVRHGATTGAGSSQTPWLTNIDADNNKLFDVQQIEFDTTGVANVTKPHIRSDATFTGDLFYSVDDTKRHVFLQNGTEVVDIIDSLIRVKDTSPNATGFMMELLGPDPIDTDSIGNVTWRAEDSRGGGFRTDYANLQGRVVDDTDPNQDGELFVSVMEAGTLRSYIHMDGSVQTTALRMTGADEYVFGKVSVDFKNNDLLSMGDETINNPTETTVIDGANDFLLIYDVSRAADDKIRKIKPDTLTAAGGGPEFDEDVFRIIEGTKKLAFDVNTITAATTKTLTVQDSSGTIALLNGGDQQTTSNVWQFNGQVLFAGTTSPTSDGALDFGTASASWANFYMKGQLIFDGATATQFIQVSPTEMRFELPTSDVFNFEIANVDELTITPAGLNVHNGDIDNLRHITLNADTTSDIGSAPSNRLQTLYAQSVTWTTSPIISMLLSDSGFQFDVGDADQYLFKENGNPIMTLNDGALVIQNNSAGQILSIFRNEVSADGTEAGRIEFEGLDSASNPHSFGQIVVEKLDQTSASEEGDMKFFVTKNSVDNTLIFQLTGQGTANGRIGVFAVTPVEQQGSTTATPTADLTYSANERDMIQDMWDALVAYGWIDET